MKMRVGIVSHPQRDSSTLSKNVMAEHVSIDTESAGCDSNHRKVWRNHLLHMDSHDWCVVLEDDAVPQDDIIRQQMCAALAVAPTAVVSFYLGKQRPPQYQDEILLSVRKAIAAQAHWIVSPRMYHAVAVAVRADKVGMLNAWLASPAGQQDPIDESISLFCKHFGLDVGYTVPSIFDHNDELPTTAIHRDGQQRTPGRTAYITGARKRWDGTEVEA